MNALAIHPYLIIRYINLSFNYFGNFYRIIVIYYSQTSWICKDMSKPHSLSKDKHICTNYTQMEWAFDICEDWLVC